MKRKSNIVVAVKEKYKPEAEPLVLPIEDAAQLTGLDVDYLLRKSSKGPFEVNDDVTIERITPVIKRRGTKIVRDDGKEWNTIKECAAEIGAQPASIAAWIRAKQCFDFNGHHYEAVNYKTIHHVHTKPKRKVKNVKMVNNTALQSLGSVPVESTGLTQQQILETLEYEVKEVANQLSTEERCIQLLQQLVKERMDSKKYTSAKQVLNALITLTE